MSYATHIVCKTCNNSFTLGAINFCPKCGRPGEVSSRNWTLEVEYDWQTLKKDITKKHLKKSNTIWRYLPLLPVKKKDIILSLGEGMTPLSRCNNIGKKWGLTNLYIKDETKNPTGSFKDRMIAVTLQKAREFNNDIILIVSDGNLGASGAAYCGKQGNVQCLIMTYPHITKAKLLQMLIHGGRVFDVRGSLKERVDLFLELGKRRGWYVVNYDSIGNPYAVEGYKTIAYEIAEQLEWQAPEHVVVPTGSGEGISGVYKGFKEFYNLGWIDKVPRIHGAQVAGNDPLVRAAEQKADDIIPLAEMKPTIVGGINTDITGYIALKAVQSSEGTGITVDDDEALEGVRQMAMHEAIYTEPASGAALYGVKKLLERGVISPEETVVCVVTSYGLKDLNATKKIVKEPYQIRASVEEFETKLGVN